MLLATLMLCSTTAVYQKSGVVYARKKCNMLLKQLFYKAFRSLLSLMAWLQNNLGLRSSIMKMPLTVINNHQIMVLKSNKNKILLTAIKMQSAIPFSWDQILNFPHVKLNHLLTAWLWWQMINVTFLMKHGITLLDEARNCMFRMQI